MTSREIADLVDQLHDNVKRTMETLGEKGVITLPQIEEVSNPGLGPKTIDVYRVGKRDSLIVVAQLCPQYTARIVDRWQELEEQFSKPDPMAVLSNPSALRLVLLEYAEKVIAIADFGKLPTDCLQGQ
jgi:phage regulator Rha-like protein